MVVSSFVLVWNKPAMFPMVATWSPLFRSPVHLPGFSVLIGRGSENDRSDLKALSKRQRRAPAGPPPEMRSIAPPPPQAALLGTMLG